MTLGEEDDDADHGPIDNRIGGDDDDEASDDEPFTSSTGVLDHRAKTKSRVVQGAPLRYPYTPYQSIADCQPLLHRDHCALRLIPIGKH